MSHIRERIAILNHPSAPKASPWNASSLGRLSELGFTAVQVNIGWGFRPADEPLNLEDVVAVPASAGGISVQELAALSDQSRFEARRSELAERIQLSRQAGLKTAFNFGAPFNHHGLYGGTPPNCILDDAVIERYEWLLSAFYAAFPIDYLWLYTYDQDAWLCSEFEDCPRCAGVPLHERLVPFLDRLTARWVSVNPGGRLWWEPWELSSGQVLRILESVDPTGFGLALHNNVAECMVAFAGDRHITNFARLAAGRGIPVTLEGFFGAATEEVEPYLALQSPLTTYRQVRAMMAVDGVSGLKEYYGIDISKPDPNLDAATICFQEPDLSVGELLKRLSADYGDNSTREAVEQVWIAASEAIELLPWDASWAARRIGLSDPCHSLDAAIIRGFCADTPAWRSTRGSTFMTVDDTEPHPWMLEDVQLRWELCAEKQLDALNLAEPLVEVLPIAVRSAFQLFVGELREFRRRIMAFAYHCRETNLSYQLRRAVEAGQLPTEHIVAELLAVMCADRENMASDDLTPAIEMLENDPREFVNSFFLPTGFLQSRGYNSVTSR
jgi:hypothetical protein